MSTATDPPRGALPSGPRQPRAPGRLAWARAPFGNNEDSTYDDIRGAGICERLGGAVEYAERRGGAGAFRGRRDLLEPRRAGGHGVGYRDRQGRAARLLEQGARQPPVAALHGPPD